MNELFDQRRYLIPFRATLLPQIFTDVLIIGGGVAGLRAAGASAEPCMLMTGTATIGPERPQTVALTAPLVRRGFCGNTYTTTSMTLTILVEGRVAREVMEPVELRIGI